MAQEIIRRGFTEMNPNIKNMTGQRCHRLFVEGLAPYDPIRRSSAYWLCKCDCGKTTIASGASLRKGAVKSCGCLQSDRTRETATSHGHSRGGIQSPEYRCYSSMKGRCYNPNNDDFPNYGGRGIAVCDRWLHGDAERTGVELFLSDLGKKPSSTHSLERRDCNGGYGPDNCYWATPKEQGRNRRHTPREGNVTLAEIAEQTGINYQTLADRWRSGDRGERLRRPVTTGRCKGPAERR